MAIGIVATLKVQDGKQAEFEAVFRDLTAQIRANEPGNLLYQACKSRKDPTTYVIMELYESDEAMTAHRNAEHFKAAGPKIGATTAGKPDIQVFETI